MGCSSQESGQALGTSADILGLEVDTVITLILGEGACI